MMVLSYNKGNVDNSYHNTLTKKNGFLLYSVLKPIDATTANNIDAVTKSMPSTASEDDKESLAETTAPLQEKGENNGVIIGAAVGGVILLLIIVALTIALVLTLRRQNHSSG